MVRPDSLSAPILIIGAGPIGLAAAAKCAAMGADFLLVEAGDRPGHAVRQWAHVRLFSPWHECLDTTAAGLLSDQGWDPPDAGEFPTGAELVANYLDPLAAHPALRDRFRPGCRIAHYSRQGMSKQSGASRFDVPFAAMTDGGETLLARAILDASGTWHLPRRLPRLGGPGEDRVHYEIPDLADASVRRCLAGKRVLIVGSGHSGMTALLDLAATLPAEGTDRIIWIRRSRGRSRPTAIPPVSARQALEARAEAATLDPRIRVVEQASIVALSEADGAVTAVGQDKAGNAVTVDADVAFILTGFRPDHSIGAELWMSVDHRWEAPVGLAPLVDPDLHCCNSVPLHGVEELSHPEKDFFIVGSKSYGRAPNFLLTTGYAQLDSIMAYLAPSARPVGPGEPRPADCGTRQCPERPQ